LRSSGFRDGFCRGQRLRISKGNCIFSRALAAIAPSTATSSPPLVFVGGFIDRRIEGSVSATDRFVGFARFGRQLWRSRLTRRAWRSRLARFCLRPFLANFVARFVLPFLAGFAALGSWPPRLALRFVLLSFVSLSLRFKALRPFALATFVAPAAVAAASPAAVTAPFAARFALRRHFLLDFGRRRRRRLAGAEPGKNLAE
jgi:hypothetical protein